METNKEGILSLVTLNGDEVTDLLKYLRVVKGTSVYDFIYFMMQEDFLKFFDVLSGEMIKIPRRDEIYKIVGYIQVYRYCKSKGFSEESIQHAAKIFGKRVNSIRRINQKMTKHFQEAGE